MSSKCRVVALSLLPLAVSGSYLAFQFPAVTDALYSKRLYLLVVRGFAMFRLWSFSLAEPLFVALVLLLVYQIYRWSRDKRHRIRRAVVAIWAGAGAVALTFLFLWGFNYARPSLQDRLGLSREGIEASVVLDAGRRAAMLTSDLYEELLPAASPTALPFDFEELNLLLDDAYDRLALPGDALSFQPAPAKPLLSSTLFSYLGISGIFIPFTGEPSVNALQPDVALPMVVAHEKAHQRGITHEGEANFAAFLACAQADNATYFRYAAYLFATRYLLGEASNYRPRDEVDAAWELLSNGPKDDIRAIRDFWRRYEGPATVVVTTMNDQYLRTMQVPDGVQSYGTVVKMLLALDREGGLFPGH